MSLSINTIIMNVDVYPTYTDSLGNTESNVVHKVYWNNICSDNLGNAATVSGETSLDTSDLSTFSEFSSLTESQVRDWIIDVWGGVGSQGHMDILQEATDALTELLNPTSINLELES